MEARSIEWRALRLWYSSTPATAARATKMATTTRPVLPEEEEELGCGVGWTTLELAVGALPGMVGPGTDGAGEGLLVGMVGAVTHVRMSGANS